MKHAPLEGDEFAYIRWIREGLPPESAKLDVGPGDDCAVQRVGPERQVLKIDSVLEGRHFLLKTPSGGKLPATMGPLADPEQVGRKALCRALSDLAAMGATPQSALCAVCLPTGADVKLREKLYKGLVHACATWGVALAGGDTQSWDGPLVVTIAMTGLMNGVRPALRSGAVPGDVVAVTGSLGGSILGRHLRFDPRLPEGRFLAERGVSAMIDISDGLSGDLTRICEESSRKAPVGADIVAEAVPVSKAARRLARLEGGDGAHALEHALHDGEDFELLVTVPPMRWKKIVADWPFDTPLRALGILRPLGKGEPVVRILRKGEPEELEVKSYVHKL